MKPLLFICAASLLLGAAAPARADAASTQLDLSASAQREVANDQLDATLYVEEQQTAPAPLADNLNRAGSAAMAAARAFPHVEATSGGYSSWPQYDKNGKITGWQGERKSG